MKAGLLFLFVVCVAPSIYSAEWFELLPPGITRSQIVQIAGEPSASSKATKSYYPHEGKADYLALIDRYDLEKGYVELSYNGEILFDCTQFSSPGHPQKTHYWYSGGLLSPIQLQRRRDYLNARQYALLPGFWMHNFVRTDKYPGSECYPIDQSFLIVSPMLFGGESGFFGDKTAKVILLNEKRKETVLYRAIDNWKNLKPPEVNDRRLKERAVLVATLKDKYPDRNFNIAEILGPPDARFGSGIPYVAYYLEDGLVVGVAMKPQMSDITIRRPGE